MNVVFVEEMELQQVSVIVMEHYLIVLEYVTDLT